MNIIEFENVTFSYDGKSNALDAISLRIAQGEFVCILGGNGSGKSTLAKHINALLVPDSGCVRVLGMDTADPDCTYDIRRSAAMVFQNPDDQIVASVIEDDVAFGPENLGIEPSAIRERVTRSLLQVGLQGFEKKETAALSGGQKQRVAIAGALAMEPRIIVFDEASAMLDPRGRAGLMRTCKELNGAGYTIVMITHFMEEACCADRVIVLEKGSVALEGEPGEVLVLADKLERLNLELPYAVRQSIALREAGVDVGVHVDEDALVEDVKRLMASNARGACMPPARPEAVVLAASAGPAIEVKDVSFTYEPVPKGRRRRNAVVTEAAAADWGNDPAHHWAVRGVSFSIARGEFFGIAGHTGSGKSTLIQMLNGLLAPSAGHVVVAGRDLSERKAAIEARREVGVVFQYPEHQLFAATVYDDVAFGPRNLGLDEAEVDRRIRHSLSLVGLDFDALSQKSPFALSGGQQRRVAFAGVLAMEPSTLVLDEPAAGLDPQSKRSFLDLVCRLHDDEGMTVVIVSHDMNDLARLCDRMLVLNQGEAFALGSPAKVFRDSEELRRIGLGLPDALRFARDTGVDVGSVPDEKSVADACAKMVSHGK